MLAKKGFLNQFLKANISKRCCSSQLEKVDKLEEQKTKFSSSICSTLKRGSGNRASFNGNVVTVFGATGCLGKHIVNQLCKIGCQVIIPYRGNSNIALALRPCGDLGQIIIQPFYLRDLQSINKAVKYSNVVINLIGKFSETPSFTFEEVHIDGAKNIARAAREKNVNRFIHVSALNANPAPIGRVIRTGSNFLRSKYFGELAVKEEFPNATIFRPAEMFSEIDNYLNYYSHFTRYSGRCMPLWNEGKDIYKQPVFMRDVALGIVNSIFENKSIGRTVDAVGPERYELRDVVKYIMRCVDKGEKDLYKVSELRTSFFFLLKTYITESILKYPYLGLEKIEFENITDMLTEKNLSLSDLGVELTKLNESYFFVKHLSRISYNPEIFKEKVEPPSPIPLNI